MNDMLVKSLNVVDHMTRLIEMFDVLHACNMKLNFNKCAFGVSSKKFLGFMVNQRGIEANSEKIKTTLEMEAPQIVKKVQRLIGRLVALNHFMVRATNKCFSFFFKF